MMKKGKLLYRTLILVVFVAANFFILRGIGSLLAFVKSGADREQMMAKVLKVNDYYKPVFTWKNLDNPGREFIEKNQGEVQRDYTDSWYVKNLNQAVNTTKGIADFYTDSSRVNLYRTIELNKKHDLTVHGTTLSHNIDVNFFSADGKLVAFDDKNVHEVYRIFRKDSLIGQQEQFSDYKIVMLLEDGFWRIRHMVRSNSTDVAKVEIDSAVDGFVKRKGKQLVLNDQPYFIRGVNYYPKETPWAMFGDKFNDTIIDNDFQKIDSLGFNTTRIFIGFETFGKEEVNEKSVQQLRRTLDLAHRNNLKVIVTLFDFFGNYDIINWTLTEQHLKGIVAPFKRHPAILAWDIKNEADLDMQVHSEQQVTSWLEFALERLKFYDPNHLSTIGWLHPHPHFAEKSATDFFTFHYYEDVDDFEKAYDKWVTHTDKPLVVGEFGMHSWNKGFLGNTQEDQRDHYQKVLNKIEKEEKHFIAWTLYDFPELPKEVFGILPWITLPQKNMGLLDVEGKPKRVMEVFEELGISPNPNFEAPEKIFEEVAIPIKKSTPPDSINGDSVQVEFAMKSDSLPVEPLSITNDSYQTTDSEPKQQALSNSKETQDLDSDDCNLQWERGFYLVAGVFGVEENAKKEIKRIRSQGLAVNCYIDKRKKLHFLAHGPFSKRAEARKMVRELKRKGTDVWLKRQR